MGAKRANSAYCVVLYMPAMLLRLIISFWRCDEYVTICVVVGD